MADKESFAELWEKITKETKGMPNAERQKYANERVRKWKYSDQDERSGEKTPSLVESFKNRIIAELESDDDETTEIGAIQRGAGKIAKGEGYKRPKDIKVGKIAKGSPRNLQEFADRQRSKILKRDAAKIVGVVKAVGKSVKKNVLEPASRLANDIHDEMMRDMAPDTKYIETGGLESEPTSSRKYSKLPKAQRVRVNHESNEIEVILPSGEWKGTGKYAEIDVPQQFTNSGVSYRTVPDYTKTQSLTPSGIAVIQSQEPASTGLQETGLRSEEKDESPFAGNPLGQMSTAAVAEYLRRLEIQSKPKKTGYGSGVFGAGLGAMSSGLYSSTFSSQKTQQAQSGNVQQARQLAQSPRVGRNPLVKQQQPQMQQAPVQETQQAPHNESLFGRGLNTLFGNGGFYGVRQEPGRMKSLFSGNMGGIGVTVGGVRTQQQGQQQTTSSESLFSGNMKFLGSGVSDMYGGNQKPGNNSLSVVGSGEMPSVFGAIWGNGKSKQPQQITGNSGDKKMTEGMIDLYRTAPAGMGVIKITLTAAEYNALSKRAPGSGLYFGQVRGKMRYTAYLTQQEIQALQAQGRLVLIPKGQQKRRVQS